jgi:uncharacterized membrane protein
MGLGDLPGGSISSFASGLSDDGRVIIGMSRSDAGDETYRWTAETGLEPLNLLEGQNYFDTSNVTALSADGTVIVGYGSGNAASREGFRWTQETGMVSLGSEFFSRELLFSLARDVSADGMVVVGTADFSPCDDDCGYSFRWTAETGMVHGEPTLVESDAYAVSGDGLVVVGGGDFRHLGQDLSGFRWTEETGNELFEVSGRAVSYDGSVIAGYENLWTENGSISLGQFFEPSGMTADGSVIVGSERFSGEALYWDSENGTQKLVDVFTNQFGLDVAGWTLADERYDEIYISADGRTIAGSGVNPSGKLEAWIATIPGPDFDVDGDVDDADALVGEIVAGTNDSVFDLSGDGAVNNADLNQWLNDAATANDFAAPYLLGDANLDGSVDSADLNKLALSWRNDVARWSAGDFTADGSVDSDDLNDLAVNWRDSIPSAASPESVPEPAAFALLLGVMATPLLRHRRRVVASAMAPTCRHVLPLSRARFTRMRRMASAAAPKK